ncbi:MAG: hypothetical protein VX399_00630, partial [SAR324 cluster bacterium]|nr:hypothetical protein [SAR324 cluster bacterium]
PSHPYTRDLLSAVPKPIPGIPKSYTKKQASFQELVQNSEPILGCPYRFRCSEAISICSEHIPELLPLHSKTEPLRKSACHASLNQKT